MIKIQLNDQVDLGGLIKMSGHSKFANIKHKKEKNDAAKGKIFTVIGREKEHELFDVLHSIICRRCHQDIVIDFDYKEPVKSKYLENAIKEMENKIAAINSRTRLCPFT